MLAGKAGRSALSVPTSYHLASGTLSEHERSQPRTAVPPSMWDAHDDKAKEHTQTKTLAYTAVVVSIVCAGHINVVLLLSCVVPGKLLQRERRVKLTQMYLIRRSVEA